MNYFEFYGIPETFNPDEAAIKRKFYALSKEFHPDFYVNDTPEKQQEILELSTINNKAYQVLSNAQKRLEYILQSNNQIAEGDKYQLPQAFLMEMMEVNEALMELEFDADEKALEETEKQVAGIEAELLTELKFFTEKYDKEQNPAERESFLLEIKDLYYRQKYLLRIRESLNRFASR
ncbi:Fe-S protein assembly co-chaperone HscB [Desertivirga xinjiangensis]|uniref:Fe-S protein assembly co-chaperone HscB n=1 Tax=Desertivirga xinjiangensis TaxID=539206 RepID=UPI00210A277C|nr:Fe-S protein assembly co-chaperone HscB [Pedobacter xinjiangensis]